MHNATTYEPLLIRHCAYDLMRRLFIEEPTVELLTFLQKETFHIFSVVVPLAEVKATVQALNAFIADHSFCVSEEAFENLHWDFTQLFIGPEMPVAPPWESYYVTKDKLLFQETTRTVETLYQKHGFDTKEKEFEAADHVGLELDFIFQLNQLVIDNMQSDHVDPSLTQNSFKLQHHFLKTHLLRFCGTLAQKMHDGAQTDFYKQLGLLLGHFLAADEKWLSAQLQATS